MNGLGNALYQKSNVVDAIFPREDLHKEFRDATSALSADFKASGSASIALPTCDERILRNEYPGLLRRTRTALRKAAQINGFKCEPFLTVSVVDGERLHLVMVAKDRGTICEPIPHLI